MRPCRCEDASHIEALPPLVDGILAGARSCRDRVLAMRTRTNIEQSSAWRCACPLDPRVTRDGMVDGWLMRNW